MKIGTSCSVQSANCPLQSHKFQAPTHVSSFKFHTTNTHQHKTAFCWHPKVDS